MIRRLTVALTGTMLLIFTTLFTGRTQSPSPPEHALPLNTWVNMHAGGIASGAGIGDEAYSTFVYSPGLKRALVFGKYHARELSWGEDQNALLAYDFASNRWEVVEITEAAWSEFLPGVGHDQGHVAIDPRRDLYITRGNMTLHDNSGHKTYIFDLKAGRGKRMMPTNEPKAAHEVASAFDFHRGVMLTTRGPSWLYDVDRNNWTEVLNSPSDRPWPSLVYDGKNRLFVMFGGDLSNETWTFETSARRWKKRRPPVSPSPRASGAMAFDSANGVALLVGGMSTGGQQLTDMWVYDAAQDTWTQLPITAPRDTTPSISGHRLVYDTHHGVFLMKDTVKISYVWAFRYAPSLVPRTQPGPGSAGG